MSMESCPSQDELLRYLEQGSGDSGLSRVAAHLGGCAACRARLENLLFGDTETPTPAGVAGRVEPEAGEPDRTITRAGDIPSPDALEAVPRPAARGGDNPPGENPPGAAADGRPADPFGTVDQNGPAAGADRAQPHEVPAGRPLVPGYVVMNWLGEGGMGVVYKARQIGLNRLVALKMIREDRQAGTGLLSRFLVEAEAVARLGHPNIIQIYDIGTADGRPFFALELLTGGSLKDHLAGNPQPPRQAAELVETLARAVHAAHQAGIVHRDLKPSNVLLTVAGVPKISDFGLAKLLDAQSARTFSGQVVGTPSYMAPEQAVDSRLVGPAADVYALGAILYEMLTGRPPFKGETPLETVRQVLHDEPVSPTRLMPRVARDLETICLKCLAKNQHRRYESALALAGDLRRFLDGEPIKARPVVFWERAAKWARRRPAAAMFLTLGTVVILGSFVGIVRYQQKREEEHSRIMTLELDATSTIKAAKKEIERKELNEAKAILSGLLGQIRGERQANLRRLTQDTATLLQEVEGLLAEQHAQDEGKARYREFLDLQKQALFQATSYTGLNLPTDVGATRVAAEAALGKFAVAGAGDSRALAELPQSFTESERDNIARGCYELLLVLAEVEPDPTSGLRVLDQAARLPVAPTMAYHRRRAACLEQAGNLVEASAERRRAAEQQRATPFDHFWMGQEDYRRRDFTAALDHFNAALQEQPDHFWAQCVSAVCLLQLHRPAEAVPRLDACLASDPEFAWLYLLRGFASSQLGADLLGLAEKKPAGKIAAQNRANRHFEDAQADYQRALKLLGSKPNADLRYALLVNQGMLAFVRRQLPRAAADLRAAAQLNPREVTALTALARVYLEQDRPDEALAQCSRAIALQPRRPDLYRARADINRGRRDATPDQRARALRDLDQAIALERPGSRNLAQDYTNRARLLALDHRDAQALEACNAALKIVADHDAAHQVRIDLLIRSKSFEQVVRSCDALLAHGPVSEWALKRRALARSEINDYPGAIGDYTHLLALATDRAPLLRQRGALYLLLGTPRLALPDFEESIVLEPSNADGYNGRGTALVGLGWHRQAVDDADKALETARPTSRQLYKSARIYAQAAIVAGAQARNDGRDTVIIVATYQDRAVFLLREALKRLPADERGVFWRDTVLADPGLQTLRRRLAPALEQGGLAVSDRAPGDKRGKRAVGTVETAERPGPEQLP
ncbi:MAG: protein kinase domain-containing protein [Isosphaeraceae bacterium]